MKCPVCSYDNLPPGLNCTRCGARMPSAPGVSKGPPCAAGPAYRAGHPRRGPKNALIAVAVMGALALGSAWFAFREPLAMLIALSGRSATHSPDVPRAWAPPVALPSPARSSEVTSDTPPPAPVTSADGSPTAATPSNSGREVNASTEPAAWESPKTPLQPRRTILPKGSQVAAPLPAPAEPKPAPVVPAPTPLATPPRPVDRWQQMASDMVNCPRENVFSRAVCEESIRLRYCEGYWGSVPECPFGRQADHGQ